MNTNGENQVWFLGKRSGTTWKSSLPEREGGRSGFTLIELLAVMGVAALLGTMLLPALARTQPGSKAIQCQNNLRQLTVGWHTWAEDNQDQLLTCQTMPGTRSNWVSGILDFNSGNVSNWDPNRDLPNSPLWRYTGQKAALFKCPADVSGVTVANQRKPRVRSLSMNQAFASGEWLDGMGAGVSLNWRTYDKLSTIRLPAKTFVFVEEHPDSINDGAFASTCTGNQPTDPPSAAKFVDFPASFHNGACGFSFADGHTELHRWVGLKVRPNVTYTGTLPLNQPAADSWVDAHWLAEHTTVHK